MKSTSAGFASLCLLCALLAASLLPACGVDKVEEVGWSDVPCFPYGADFYDGTYTFDGTWLDLAVVTANSRCCLLIETTWPYQVRAITETELVLSLEGEPEQIFTRTPGAPGDIVGRWERDGQTFDFRADGTCTGADDPRCLEPVECGALPPARGPVPFRQALAAWLPLLAPAMLIFLRRRTHRNGARQR